MPVSSTLGQDAFMVKEDQEAHDKLLKLFAVYIWVLPVELVLGAFVAYIRALQQQRVFIYCQIIVFYGFHTVALYFFLWWTSYDGVGLVFNLGLTYTVMIICTAVITLNVDWMK